MSTKAIAFFLVIAGVLLGTVLYLTRGGGGTPGSGASPNAAPPAASTPWFDPAQVRAIVVRREGAPDERVERAPGGGWSYRAGRVEWPVLVPDAAVSSLGAIAQALVAQTPTSPPAAQPGDRTIVLEPMSGEAVSLRVSAAALGGKSPVLATSGTRESAYLIESALVMSLLEPGPRAWRTTQVLPGAGEASRLTLTDPDATLVLAKLENRWDVRRPIAARASQQAVSTLLGALGGLHAVRFEDAAADPSAYGLNKPGLVITLETDERMLGPGGEVTVQVRTRELVVGGPADPKGDTRFVAPDLEGSLVMVVPSAGLAAISTAPRNYLAPTATALAGADVFMVNIKDSESPAGAPGSERALRRDLDRWTRIDGAARTPVDTNDVTELLDFFTRRPGVPSPAEGPDEMRVLRRVEFFDDEGDQRDIVSVGYTPDGALAVRSGNVLVTYSNATAPALLEMPAPESLPPAPARPGAVEVKPGAPTEK